MAAHGFQDVVQSISDGSLEVARMNRSTNVIRLQILVAVVSDWLLCILRILGMHLSYPLTNHSHCAVVSENNELRVVDDGVVLDHHRWAERLLDLAFHLYYIKPFDSVVFLNIHRRQCLP